METSRRERRLQRERQSPPTDIELDLPPEVFRAVATKMRTRMPVANERMPINRYILSKVFHEFVDALESVATDTEERVVKFSNQQRDTNGKEGPALQ